MTSCTTCSCSSRDPGLDSQGALTGLTNSSRPSGFSLVFDAALLPSLFILTALVPAAVGGSLRFVWCSGEAVLNLSSDVAWAAMRPCQIGWQIIQKSDLLQHCALPNLVRAFGSLGTRDIDLTIARSMPFRRNCFSCFFLPHFASSRGSLLFCHSVPVLFVSFFLDLTCSARSTSQRTSLLFSNHLQCVREPTPCGVALSGFRVQEESMWSSSRETLREVPLSTD